MSRQIEENQFVPPRPHPSPIPPHTPISPTHGHSSSSCPPPGSSWPHHYPPRPGQVPVPIIPPRTMESLSKIIICLSNAGIDFVFNSLLLGTSLSRKYPHTPHFLYILSLYLLETTDPEVEPENPYLSILGQSASGLVSLLLLWYVMILFFYRSQPTTPASVTSESGYGQHIAHVSGTTLSVA